MYLVTIETIQSLYFDRQIHALYVIRVDDLGINRHATNSTFRAQLISTDTR